MLTRRAKVVRYVRLYEQIKKPKKIKDQKKLDMILILSARPVVSPYHDLGMVT